MTRLQRWLSLTSAIGLVTVAPLSAGCQRAEMPPDDFEATPAVLTLPTVAPEAWASRGDIVFTDDSPPFAEPFREFTSLIQRVVYRSISGVNGQPTEVSGVFAVPRNEPPPGGWPVISFAHGTTGILNRCGPSNFSDLAGYGAALLELVQMGYAVAFTDYEGLGDTGSHPYLEPRTAAFNVTDAVRALRHITPAVSDRWLALGGSQGGQASWAADELDEYYGDGLHLVGAVATAPAADISEVARLAFSESLAGEQVALIPMIVVGLERSGWPLDRADFVHGPVARNLDAVVGCDNTARMKVLATATMGDVRPASLEAAYRLRDALHAQALPQRPLAAPLLVVNGLEDKVVPPQWVSEAVDRACRLGGRVTQIEVAGRGHADLPLDESIRGWVANAFAGGPVHSNCPA